MLPSLCDGGLLGASLMQHLLAHAQAWRHHPLLKVNKNNLVPGLGVGIAMFVAFKFWESTAPKDEHHH